MAARLTVLMLLLVHSSRGVSCQRISDEIALLGLDDNNTGVRSEKERNVGAIADERVSRAYDRRKDSCWLVISQN